MGVLARGQTGASSWHYEAEAVVVVYAPFSVTMCARTNLARAAT